MAFYHWSARQRTSAAGERERLHPGESVTFPLILAQFKKARGWEAPRAGDAVRIHPRFIHSFIVCT